MDGAGEQAVREEFAAGSVATLLASLETIEDIVEAEVMNFGGRKGSQEDSNEPVSQSREIYRYFLILIVDLA
jgi:hypothetical protein